MTRMRQFYGSFLVLSSLMLAPTASNAVGQGVENVEFLSDSPISSEVQPQPSNTQGFYPGPVIPTAAMTTAARVLNRVNQVRNGKQIRVSIRFLAVDPETRAAIYEKLDVSQLKTTAVESMPRPMITLDGLDSEIQCTESIVAPSHATTAVLEKNEAVAILQAINQTSQSNVTAAPSVVMFDAQTGEVNTTVQRPFMTGIEGVAGNGKTHAKAKVQVFDEGTTVRLKPTVVSTAGQTVEQIHLATELITKTIIDVKGDRVFGISDEPASIQSPLHRTKSVVAAEQLELGQTLLIDPYVTKQVQKEVETGVPILTKIPYVSRSFKNVGIVTQDQQMMVLVTPAIEESLDE